MEGEWGKAWGVARRPQEVEHATGCGGCPLVWGHISSHWVDLPTVSWSRVRRRAVEMGCLPWRSVRPQEGFQLLCEWKLGCLRMVWPGGVPWCNGGMRRTRLAVGPGWSEAEAGKDEVTGVHAQVRQFLLSVTMIPDRNKWKNISVGIFLYVFFSSLSQSNWELLWFLVWEDAGRTSSIHGVRSERQLFIDMDGIGLGSREHSPNQDQAVKAYLKWPTSTTSGPRLTLHSLSICRYHRPLDILKYGNTQVLKTKACGAFQSNWTQEERIDSHLLILTVFRREGWTLEVFWRRASKVANSLTGDRKSWGQVWPELPRRRKCFHLRWEPYAWATLENHWLTWAS
jgi:hypothetical protein